VERETTEERKERKKMKNLKIATIATIMTALIITLCGITMTATAENLDTYTVTAVVTAWENIGDTTLTVVTVTDENGNLWDFFDDEEFYKIGDVVTVTMWKVEDDEEADEVLDVEKIDHLEWFDLFQWLTK
jgi:flagellar basal body L-ring protein FlgH